MKIKPSVKEILEKNFFKKNKYKFILSTDKLSNESNLYIYIISKKEGFENIYNIKDASLNMCNIDIDTATFSKEIENGSNDYDIKFNLITENTYEIVKEKLHNILINKHLDHHLLVLFDNADPKDKSIIYHMYKIKDFMKY